MRGPRPYRSGSSSFWPSFGLLVVIVVGLVVLALVAGVLALRWRDYRDAERADLGPGPIRGVRLVESRPRDTATGCDGLPTGLPVVRLVEQVPVDRIDLCLNQTREPPASGEPSQHYRLARTDGTQAAEELDQVAATFSLPDDRLPWWRDRNHDGCPERYVVYLPYPMVVTVGDQQFWIVAPSAPCGPLEAAYGVSTGVAKLAEPTG